MNDFKHVFVKHKRVAITGAPKTGKTTLANSIKTRYVLHTDDHRHGIDWSKQSEILVEWSNAQPAPFVVEGVTVARALRKGMKVDAVIYLTQPKVEQTPKQVSMGRAVRTVFNEWRAANPHVKVYFEGEPLYEEDHAELRDE